MPDSRRPLCVILPLVIALAGTVSGCRLLAVDTPCSTSSNCRADAVCDRETSTCIPATPPGDAGELRPDAGPDPGPDAGPDAGPGPGDAGTPPLDAGAADAGPALVDAGPTPGDAGPVPTDGGDVPQDAGTEVLVFPAAEAGCLFLAVPSTDAAYCDSILPGELPLDTSTDDPGVLSEARSFVAFVLDASVVGRTVVAAELRLQVDASGGNDSGSTGEVWLCDAFTLATLSTDAPPAANTKIGDDQGAVVEGEDIVIPLDAAGVMLSEGRLHMALVPVSGDGLAYVATGDFRPRVAFTFVR